ncbi:MAG: DUF721 domain-containing protein [Negativicutes bacterium]|nr:DUF721 domain-containing protein [Negativicutes bacterium]
MDKIGTTIQTVIRRMAGRQRIVACRIIGDWPRIVGEKIAAHSCPYKLRGKELLIAVDHPLWLTELTLMKGQIVEKIENIYQHKLELRLRFNLRRLEKYDRDGDDRYIPPPVSDDDRRYAAEICRKISNPKLKQRIIGAISAWRAGCRQGERKDGEGR